MKKAFTLIELLVVIAIIAILAAMLMPALVRARTQAQQTDCKYKVRQVGMGFELFRTDNNGVYPGWVSDDITNELRNDGFWNPATTDQSADAQARRAKARYAAPTNGGPYFQLINKGYIDDVDLFDCPSADNLTWGDWYGPEVIEVNDPTGWTPNKVVRFPDYSYDLGRVSKNSAAGRGYYGDSWTRRHMWADSWGYWESNHPGGANLVFIDGSAEWCDIADTDVTWNLNTGGTWNRAGYVANPRMDEDVNRLAHYQEVAPGLTELDLIFPRDRDDIYAQEGWCAWGGYWSGGAGGGTWYSNSMSYFGDPLDPAGSTETTWGNSKTNVPAPGEPGNAGMLTRCYHYWGDTADNHSRWYPEVGPFADEGRWDGHDCRLLPINWIVPASW